MPEHFAAWLDARQRDPVVRLLPAYDVYLLGYRSREFMVSSAEARQLHPGGGQIRPCLLVDGRAAGTWRIERKKSVAIVVAPFAPLSKACLAGVEAEAQDIGRFLQLAGPVAVRIEAP